MGHAAEMTNIEVAQSLEYNAPHAPSATASAVMVIRWKIASNSSAPNGGQCLPHRHAGAVRERSYAIALIRAGDFAGVSQDLLFRRQLECYLVASQVLSAARIGVPDGLHFKCAGSGASRPAFNGWQQIGQNPMQPRPWRDVTLHHATSYSLTEMCLQARHTPGHNRQRRVFPNDH